MSWNAKYALLLTFSIVVTWISGLLIQKANENNSGSVVLQKRLCVALSVILNLLVLVFFKYANFIVENINRLCGILRLSDANIKNFDIVLPVGISFYIFQALGYTIDVYRGDIKAEKNLARYALFVSFFPQLVAGPIERSRNLLRQMYDRHSFNTERVKNGLLLMLWGYFEKIVISDRISILVDTVFNNYANYTGFIIIVAAVLFAVQIYCDFAGYTHIAIGAAQVLGFRLMKNFNQPYFAVSIQDFWRRWHISLSTWLRDYVYFPLGGSRCSKARHQINLLITFLISGIWHGASWHYIIWGGLHGLYQVAGNILKPARRKLTVLTRVNTKPVSWRIFRMLCTFVLVDITWIFFRAPSFRDAVAILKRIPDYNPWVFFDGTLYKLGLSAFDFWASVVAIAILFAVDFIHDSKPGFSFRTSLARQNIVFRWTVYILAVMAILIFGIYGPSYNPQAFIYFQF
jgi:D-alanyl-lipoteichoic acid acyltransferase DltB (MBOAT superfamily)